MGGNLFPQATRISPPDYTTLCLSLTHALAPIFPQLHIPIPAPGKPSHGDIDILTHGPDPASAPALLALLTPLLAPTATHLSGPNLHLALPYPSAFGPRVAQLDIRLCPSPRAYRWLAFRNAHGAGGALLGAILHPHGLVLGDVGLYVSVGPRRARRVMLSDEPGAVLEFVGLDERRWCSPFETERELYAFLAGCRVLGRGTGAYHCRPGGVEKRPIFSGFWEFVDGLEGRTVDSEAVREEALDFFGRREEYDWVRVEVEMEEREAIAERALRDFMRAKTTSKDGPNEVVRAMRRWVVLEGEQLSMRDQAEMEADKVLRLGDLLHEGQLREEVQTWLDQHWMDLKARERERVKGEKAARQAATLN